MYKIATKVAKRLKKRNSVKVIHLNEYRESKDALSKEISKLRDAKELIERHGYEVQHAIYVQTQNTLSLLIEILAELPEFQKHARTIDKAMDDYMPSWPPMSPISTSYFFGYMAFDIQVGIDNESLAGCISELHSTLAIDQSMYHVISLMNQSRTGIYKVIENIKEKVILEEIFTKKQYLCSRSNQYIPSSGELWLVRLLA